MKNRNEFILSNELNDLEEWIVFLKECNEKHDSDIIEKLSSRKEEIDMAVKIMNKLSAYTFSSRHLVAYYWSMVVPTETP